MKKGNHVECFPFQVPFWKQLRFLMMLPPFLVGGDSLSFGEKPKKRNRLNYSRFGVLDGARFRLILRGGDEEQAHA